MREVKQAKNGLLLQSALPGDRYYQVLSRTIKDYQGLSRTGKDYQGLSMTIKDCQGLSRTVMDWKTYIGTC